MRRAYSLSVPLWLEIKRILPLQRLVIGGAGPSRPHALVALSVCVFCARGTRMGAHVQRHTDPDPVHKSPDRDNNVSRINELVCGFVAR